MKLKLLLLILFIGKTGFSQMGMQTSELILKSGDTISGIIGKPKKDSFKYREHPGAKAKEVPYSQLVSSKIMYSKDDIKTTYYFSIKGKEKYVGVEETYAKGDLKLYKISSFIYNPGTGMGGMGGGMAMGSASQVTNYYIKKESENELTYLGAYMLLNNELKNNALAYFADCNKLISKIEEKDFKPRKHMEEIVDYYAENCAGN